MNYCQLIINKLCLPELQGRWAAFAGCLLCVLCEKCIMEKISESVANLSEKNIYGTLGSFSALNSAVKKLSVKILNNSRHPRSVACGIKPLKNRYGLQMVYRGSMKLTYIQQITNPVNRL